MRDWFIGLFTLEHLGYFMLGVTAAVGWHFLKARFQHKVLIIKWHYIAFPLVLGLASYMAVETQQSADCVREFQQVLRDRSTVTSENDRLSIEQRELIYEWIHNLIFPPPDIAELPGSDPRREAWAIALTEDTDKKFAESLEQQRENDEYRLAHPLPPPRCGL